MNKNKVDFKRRWVMSPSRKLLRMASFCLALLMLTALIYAEGPKPINAFNGADWCTWSHTTKYVFLMGFLTGSYVVQQGAGNLGYLSYEEVESLQMALPRKTTVEKILAEVDGFYAANDKRIPLTVGIILRNERGLPRWSELETHMKGWSYD